MPFVYLDRPQLRKHGPAGYTNYQSFKPWLRDEFQFRCAYCLERERWNGGHAAFASNTFSPKAIRKTRR
jgi:hypothetical protein